MIKLSSISKTYDGGSTYSVQNFDLEIRSGELLVLLGSSGSGKSTVLKMINRLIEPTSGSIEIDGEPINQQDAIALRRKIGYVFQEIGLFPHMTVEQNVSIVPRLRGWQRERVEVRAGQLLDMIGLPAKKYGKRLPTQLSGGQQQRVGVARALASDPDYLLMDEPFGALDAVTRDNLQLVVLDLKTRLNKTIVFVTHDLFEALTLGDRIAIMDGGRLEQVGTKDEILSAPKTPFVSELFAKPAKQLAAFHALL